jgi:hypothetical protein
MLQPMNRPPEPLAPLTPVEERPRLSGIADAIARLDAAAKAATPPGHYEHAILVDSATEICRVARDGGLQVEQMLIAVKDAWRATPGRVSRRSGAAEDGLDQLITLCIREYYTPRGD